MLFSTIDTLFILFEVMAPLKIGGKRPQNRAAAMPPFQENG
jgi:hypothetical protein